MLAKQEILIPLNYTPNRVKLFLHFIFFFFFSRKSISSVTQELISAFNSGGLCSLICFNWSPQHFLSSHFNVSWTSSMIPNTRLDMPHMSSICNQTSKNKRLNPTECHVDVCCIWPKGQRAELTSPFLFPSALVGSGTRFCILDAPSHSPHTDRHGGSVLLHLCFSAALYVAAFCLQPK